MSQEQTRTESELSADTRRALLWFASWPMWIRRVIGVFGLAAVVSAFLSRELLCVAFGMVGFSVACFYGSRHVEHIGSPQYRQRWEHGLIALGTMSAIAALISTLCILFGPTA